MHWQAHLATDFKQSLILKDLAGMVFDLTGHSVSSEVVKKGKKTSLLSVIPTVTAAAAGAVDWEMTDTQVNNLGAGFFETDILVIRIADSYRFRTEKITIEIKAGVS